MNRMNVSVLLIALILGVAGMTGQVILSGDIALAQPAKVRHQWGYASLVIGDAAGDVHWQTGNTTKSSQGDVTKPDPSRGINELYRQLGGKEQNPTFGMLLDVIGQEGWEMVSYTRPSGIQTYIFKRPT